MKIGLVEIGAGGPSARAPRFSMKRKSATESNGASDTRAKGERLLPILAGKARRRIDLRR